MKQLSDIYVLKTLGEKLENTIIEMDEDGVNVEVVDVIAEENLGDAQADKVIKFFQLESKAKGFSDGMALDGNKIYDSSIWDDVIKPNILDIANEIKSEFNIPESYDIVFNHDDFGNFSMLLVKE